MVSSRAVVLAATGVLAITAAGFIGASAGSDRAAEKASPTADRSTAASAPASPSAGTAAATHSPAGTPTTSPTGRPHAGSTAPGPASEILPTPAGPSSTSTGYSLPPVPTTKPAPLLAGGLPKPAVAKGRLVDGFPKALAPPKGARIESSSVSVATHVLQAALVATGSDPQTVLLHYRELLVGRGFVERPTQGLENAPAAAFAQGEDNVTVTVQDGRTYLLANLRAKDASD